METKSRRGAAFGAVPNLSHDYQHGEWLLTGLSNGIRHVFEQCLSFACASIHPQRVTQPSIYFNYCRFGDDY